MSAIGTRTQASEVDGETGSIRLVIRMPFDKCKMSKKFRAHIAQNLTPFRALLFRCSLFTNSHQTRLDTSQRLSGGFHSQRACSSHIASGIT
jgi:hypothetical protein